MMMTSCRNFEVFKITLLNKKSDENHDLIKADPDGHQHLITVYDY